MRPVEVRGNSLGTLAPAGTRLVLLEGYYRCNAVRRGDVVALRYGGDKSPLSKVVHGVPGDRLALEVTARGERLSINGQVAKTSEGVPFEIDAAADRMLRGYVRGFGGVIPKDAYLVLGDRSGRTVDSRRFGLVARADLLGLLVPAPAQ
jgi:signal peptidase I